jgi:hypothetical protein
LVLATVSAARRSTSTLGVISSGSWFWVARKEYDMIGVVVTFRFGDNFDEQVVRKIADTARARFEGMPGLRSKAFTFNSAKREAANFYVWDSEDAAKRSSLISCLSA